MARHVRNRISWDKESDRRIAGRTIPLGIIGNISGNKHHVNESTSFLGYGRIGDFKANLDFAAVNEAEALLRRARMLQ